ncbi:MAG TPA: SIS domain-containing protein [Verrucomicrobiae bacterium]|nr:SIS domain-containing protein [Verrucomicrobiae bacterium]
MERIGHGILASIEALPEQILAGWRTAKAVRFPSRKTPSEVIISGMGGSGLGADVIRSAFADRLRVPFTVVNGYHLPSWTSRNSLVVLSSYSGTTEETLSTAAEALKKKARVAAITTGGSLLELAKVYRWPHVLIDEATNPSNQPRMAIGSAAFALAGLLVKAGVLKIADREIRSLASFLKRTATAGVAQDVAEKGEFRFLLLIGAEHLTGASHVFNNQINENAKQLSTYLALPEIDHHLLEGISFPEGVKKHLLAIFFQSDLYHPQNRKRVELTAELFAEHGIEPLIVTPEGKTKLEQAWQAIQFGSRVSLALAQKHRIDPEPVPNVARLKRKLA